MKKTFQVLNQMVVDGAIENYAVAGAAQTLDYEGTPVRVVLAEYLLAIMLKVGRLKDYARIEMFVKQDAVDYERFEEIIARYGLQEKWLEYKRKFLK